MPRIIISYRRQSTAGIAGRIYDRLARYFGADHVFIDYDAIPFGVDFRTYLDREIKAVDCLVAVIGQDWTGERPGGGSRINDPTDPVRVELETALRNGIRVLPVLVDGAEMPQALALPPSLRDVPFLNAPRIDTGVDFHVHLDRLIHSIEDGGRRPDFLVTPERVRRLDNLPKRRSPLIGREQDVVAIASLVETNALVTVTGAGGVGKTSIALEIARESLDRYRDGAFFVDLAPHRGTGLVADEIASAMNLPRTSERSALETVLDDLRHRRLLLIVDNCEHVIGEVAETLDAILRACPDIDVVATSREPLHIDGERVYRLPSLATAPEGPALAKTAARFGSIALFAARVAMQHPGFELTDANASAVADICRRLDGIPLAIEMASAHAGAFGIGELRDRLDERFRVLTQGWRTALPRQQTMRATIDWSYDLLDERKRALFRRLSVFVDGFTLEAAGAVGSDERFDEFDVAAELASLVDKSMLSALHGDHTVRYRMLESTREYAYEKLEESGERDDAAHRFAEWYLTFVERAHVRWETVPTKRWFAETKPELENLRSALTWTLAQRNDIALGQRIAAGARRLWGRIAPNEGAKWITLAEELVDNDAPSDIAAALWLSDAHVHIALQQYKRALEYGERARSSYAVRSSSTQYLEACGFSGCALTMLGRGAEAEPLLVEAVREYRRLGAQQLAAYAMVDLAFLHLMRDDIAAAREVFQEALALFREVGNDRGIGSVSMNLAEIAFRSGDVRGALACGETALSGDEEEQLPIYLANMAAYLVANDQWDLARERARQCMLRPRAARSEMDTLYTVQHIAAIAALRPAKSPEAASEDGARAARLIGFVNARLNKLESVREFVEQREYERLDVALNALLGTRRYAELQAAGASWSENLALSEAALV